MQKQYSEIARVYRTKRAEVRSILSDFGLPVGSVAQDIATIVQALDAESFALRFWTLDESHQHRLVGEILGAVSSLGSSVMGLIGQKAAIKNDAANRDFQSQMQGNQFQQDKDMAYVQQLMQDKDIAWNTAHDYNESTNLIISEISKQENADSNQKMIVIVGVFAVVGFVVWQQKKKAE